MRRSVGVKWVVCASWWGQDFSPAESPLSPPFRWLRAQIQEKKAEPNSGLGQAISYFLNHWRELTLFLRQPAAPVDNNVCERALKKVILHCKNALFYKNQNGAQVGDLFMSLIHTCELSDANPFDDLTQLQRHASELAESPRDCMPWNHCATLAQLDTAAGSGTPNQE